MQVLIRQGYESFKIQVPQLGRLDELKRIIAAREEVVPTQIQVVFKRRILMDNQVLKDIGITEGTLVDIIVSRNPFEIPFTHPEEVGLTKLPLIEENEGPSTTTRDAFMMQEKVRMLMNMGFQLEQVRTALQLANGDVITAASYLPLDDDKITLIKTTRPRPISKSSPIRNIEKVAEPRKIEVLEPPSKSSPNKVKESPIPSKATKEEEVIAKVKEFVSNKKRCNLIANLIAGVDKRAGKKIKNNPDLIVELVKRRQEEKKALKGYSPTQKDSIKKLVGIGLPLHLVINVLTEAQWNFELAIQYINAMAKQAASGLDLGSTSQMFRAPMNPARPSSVGPRTTLSTSVPLNNPVSEESTLAAHMDPEPDTTEASPEQEETTGKLRPRGGFRRRG